MGKVSGQLAEDVVCSIVIDLSCIGVMYSVLDTVDILLLAEVIHDRSIELPVV